MHLVHCLSPFTALVLFSALLHSATSRLSQCGPCSQKLSGSASGTITSPNYPDPYKPECFCEYAITVPSDGQVSMKFPTANLRYEDENLKDFLVLFNGDSCRAQRIAAVFKPTDEVFVTSRSSLVALFISNGQNENGGFVGNYSTVSGKEVTRPKDPFPGNWILTTCGTDVSLGVRGSLTYAGTGMPNSLCIWRLLAPAAHVIRLIVTKMQISGAETWTRLLDGGACGSTELFYGNGAEPFTEDVEVITTGNQATWVVHSAYGSRSEKVGIFYYVDKLEIPETTVATTTTTPTTTTTTPTTTTTTTTPTTTTTTTTPTTTTTTTTPTTTTTTTTPTTTTTTTTPTTTTTTTTPTTTTTTTPTATTTTSTPTTTTTTPTTTTTTTTRLTTTTTTTTPTTTTTTPMATTTTATTTTTTTTRTETSSTSPVTTATSPAPVTETSQNVSATVKQTELLPSTQSVPHVNETTTPNIPVTESAPNTSTSETLTELSSTTQNAPLLNETKTQETLANETTLDTSTSETIAEISSTTQSATIENMSTTQKIPVTESAPNTSTSETLTELSFTTQNAPLLNETKTQESSSANDSSTPAEVSVEYSTTNSTTSGVDGSSVPVTILTERDVDNANADNTEQQTITVSTGAESDATVVTVSSGENTSTFHVEVEETPLTTFTSSSEEPTSVPTTVLTVRDMGNATVTITELFASNNYSETSHMLIHVTVSSEGDKETSSDASTTDLFEKATTNHSVPLATETVTEEDDAMLDNIYADISSS